MFTSFQVQFTPDLERYFRKENENKLEKINSLQNEANLKDYEPRSILLIYLDFTKTESRSTKNEEHLTN
jgi:hypothetical protein